MGERLDFAERAELSEQMDEPCSYEELRDCLRHLAWMNRLTRKRYKSEYLVAKG